jgi:hypothetical protein
MAKIHFPSNRSDYESTGDYATGKSFYRARQIDIQSIADQGNNIWRYTLTSGSNVEDLFLVGKATFQNCTNANNDGTFPIVTVNRATPYVEVENSSGVAQVGAAGTLSLDEEGRALNVHIDKDTDSVAIGDHVNRDTEHHNGNVTTAGVPETISAATNRPLQFVHIFNPDKGVRGNDSVDILYISFDGTNYTTLPRGTSISLPCKGFGIYEHQLKIDANNDATNYEILLIS